MNSPGVVLLMMLFAACLRVEAQEPIAKGLDKFFGSAYSSQSGPRVDFEKHWNQVTPENAGKWGSVESTRDVMNWSALDAAYNFAKEHEFLFKWHVLIWGSQQPGWIKSLPPEEQLEEIEEWFAAIAARYPDLEVIEVVNEPLHDPPTSTGDNANDAGSGGYYEALGGRGESGWDWVLSAFRMAREYFPEAQLMLNDYGIINDVGAINNYKKIIGLLQEEDLIDQVGIQGHAFNVNDLSASTIKNNLNLLAETGLPIYVTELDIDGPTDEEQLARYQEVFPAFWTHEAVKGVTLWGYRSGMWRTAQKAYLFNPADSSPRPAYTWLRNYVETYGTSEPLYAKTDVPFSIYPNPVTGGVFDIRNLPADGTVDIIDLKGNVIESNLKSEGALLKVTLGKVPSGIYIVRISTNSGISTQKLLVR